MNVCVSAVFLLNTKSENCLLRQHTLTSFANSRTYVLRKIFPFEVIAKVIRPLKSS